MLSDRIKAGDIKKCSPDKEQARSLFASAQRRLKFISGVELDDDNAPYVFVEYYESLRTLCSSLMLSSGFKAYVHSAVKDYLESIGEDKAARVFDEARRIRNRVNYYGRLMSKAESRKRIDDMTSAFSDLEARASRNV